MSVRKGKPESSFLGNQPYDLKDLKGIWEKWSLERQVEFKRKYGEIALLLNVEIDWQLIKAIMPLWDPSYRFFTINQEDMTPTIEEYSFILRIEPQNAEKVFWKKVKNAGFKKKLSQLMKVEEAVVEQNIRKKGKSECFVWNFFKRYIAKNDGEDRVVDVFALAIYGLVIFPKVPGHVEVAGLMWLNK